MQMRFHEVKHNWVVVNWSDYFHSMYVRKDAVRNIEKFIKNEIDLDQDGLVSEQEMVEKMEKTFLRQRQNEVGVLMHKYDISKWEELYVQCWKYV